MGWSIVLSGGALFSVVGLIVKYAMDYQANKSDTIANKDNIEKLSNTHCSDIEKIDAHFLRFEEKIDKTNDLIIQLTQAIPKRAGD